MYRAKTVNFELNLQMVKSLCSIHSDYSNYSDY